MHWHLQHHKDQDVVRSTNTNIFLIYLYFHVNTCFIIMLCFDVRQDCVSTVMTRDDWVYIPSPVNQILDSMFATVTLAVNPYSTTIFICVTFGSLLFLFTLCVNYPPPDASPVSPLSTQGLHFLSLSLLSALARDAYAHCEFMHYSSAR